MELSEKQKQAVESTAKHIAIIAAAGSGKTRTLTERISYLIDKRDVKATEILALTFTAKAANEMKKRIINNIGAEAKGLWVKTFHSFGLQLLRMYPEYSGLPERFEVADTGIRNQIISNIIHKTGLVDESGQVLLKISKIKNGIIECPADFKPIFDEYNSTMRLKNYIDLDDMVWLTVEMVKNHRAVKNYLHGRFRHILVDEYQDTNKIQNELIMLSVSNEASLCIVGDDDQCIYEWRGSQPNLIRDFIKHKNVETIYLNENYRSQKLIISIANRFIKNNRNRIAKEMIPKISSNVKPEYIKVDSEEDEAIHISSIIKMLCSARGYRYNQIAVLLRNSKQAQPICTAFRNCNIPYTRKNEDENSEFMTFVRVLNAIIDYKRDNNLAKAINFPDVSLDNITYWDFVDDYNLDGSSAVDNLSLINENNEIEWNTGKQFRERYGKIVELNRKISENAEFPTSAILEELLCFYESEGCDTKFIKTCIAVNSEWEETADKCDIVSFVDYLMCAIENEDEVLQFNSVDCVNIMTCHRSKGLEFPVVIIPGVQVGIFPNDFFIHSVEDLEQERRLFYVAVTRAIERLYITSYKNPFGSSDNSIVEKGFVAEMPELFDKRSE